MTEQSDPIPQPAVPPKTRRWPRRIRRLVILLLALAILSRVIVAIAFPTVLRRVANYYGLNCTYDRLELSMLSGDAGLWHLTFTPKTGGEPIFESEYVRGDISVLNLLRGKLAVWRVEADGVEIRIDRNADGSIPLLKLLTTKATAPTSPSPVPATATSQPAKAIDLSAPLRIDALRLTHIKTRIRDQSVSPPLDATLTLNLRLSNLGWVNAPVHFAIDMDADPILDAMHVEGDGRSDAHSVNATLSGKVDGLRLHPLEPYLRALGVLPIANEISLKATGNLTLAPSTANPSVLAGALKLDNLSAVADGEEAAALDHFTLSADTIDPRNIKLTNLTIDEARVTGRRSAGGRIRIGGVELIGAPPSTQPAATTTQSPITLPAIRLATFNLQHLHAGFHDDAMTPPVATSVELHDFKLSNIVFDQQQPDAIVQLSGKVSAQGLFREAIFKGSATPFATKKTLDLNLQAQGIAPTTLAPYLDAIGIESRLHDATFACNLSADVSLPKDAIAADAEIKDIKFSDGGDLFAMDHASIDRASYQMKPPLVRLENVEIAGPSLSIQHEADGSLAALGFATKPRTALRPQTSAPPSSQPSTAPSPMTIPALQIDHFLWNGIDIRYADRSLNPPLETKLSDAGVELKNIKLGTSDQTAGSPGSVHIWAKVPDMIDRFSVEGSLTPTQSTVACDLKIDGGGLTASAIKPYLKSLGVETTLTDGSFDADVKADISTSGVALDAEKLRLSDGKNELAGVDALKIGSTSFKNDQLNIGDFEVDRPRIDVSRQADGDLALLGVRFSPEIFKHPVTSAVPTTPPATQPAAAQAPSLPIDVDLKSLTIKEATLKWSDQAAKPGVSTSATANVQLAELKIGKSSQPAHLHADAAVQGSIDSASIDGTVDPSFTSPSISLKAIAQGLRAGQLAAYLPAGISVPLRDGQFHAQIEAGATTLATGGAGAKLIVSDLDYRDASQPQTLFKMDSLRLIASQIDPAKKIFAIDEISTAGVETSARRTATGGVGLLGIELNPAAAVASAGATAKPDVDQDAVAPTVTPPADVAALIAKARERGPAISVDKLDLNLKSLTLSDDTRPAAAPLVVSDLHFRNMAPIDWGGRDAESRAATPFRMDCTLDPIVGAVTLTAQVAPLAASPTAVIDLTAADIRGNGFTDLAPELKPYLDGSSLENGLFHAHLETTLRVNRRGAWAIDVSRGLSADLDMKDISFRNAPGGSILLGLDNIHSDGIFISPASGDVHVKTLEITNPIGRVTHETDGIHLMGMVFKLPKTKGEPTTAPAEPSSPAVAQQTEKPKSEIRVDQLLISNIDFIAEDNTMTPPLVFPLNALDVEVRDFSTLAPFEDKPIRFNALVNADKVPLPRKLAASGIGGALGDAASMLGGKHVATTREMEKRELFAQASANGMLGLYPTPHGWVKSSISGLELAGLSGAAKEEGITLAGGVFDCTADARLPGDGTIRTSSRFSFTDLSLAEPPDGPIFRFLHLPAPLDVVVGALQDDEGSINVPIDVPIRSGKLTASEVAGPAIGAFGSIVATAIASAPLKVAGGVTDLLGLGGNKKHAPEAPVVLPFEPGYTALTGEEKLQLSLLAQRMAKDKSLNLVIHHDLGGGDLTVAYQRANPSTTDAQNMAEQIRQQQLDALQQRSQLAGQARAELAWGSTHDAEATIDQLRTLDQQIAKNDDALDRLYAMLRPGADRQSARRTRGACLEYGRERLDAVKAALKSAGIIDMDRVHMANPQFAQIPGDDGGKIVVTLVPKKKE